MGILEADKAWEAQKNGLPFLFVSPIYSKGWRQRIENFTQVEDFYEVSHQDIGFVKKAEVFLKANNQKNSRPPSLSPPPNFVP